MKIIHTADVHLGASPDMGYPWEAQRSASLWHTFKNLIETAKSDDIDMLLISGDLFHAVPTTEQLKEIDYLFSKIPRTTVVMCAGNHDYMGNDNPYAKFNWSPNVIGLWDRELQSVSVPDKDVRVYGLSYYSNEAEDDLYENAHKYGNEKYHILLLHGGDAAHSPIKKERLAAMDFDYIAMGHIHKPGYVIKNKAAYCGALSPIDKNDIGEHGYIFVNLNDGKTDINFIPFSSYKYETLEIDCDNTDTLMSVEEKIKAAVTENGEENSYRLIMQGSGFDAERLRLSELWRYGKILDIEDKTQPSEDLDELSRRYKGTILDEFINELKSRNDDVGKYAIKEGIQAITQAMGIERRGK